MSALLPLSSPPNSRRILGGNAPLVASRRKLLGNFLGISLLIGVCILQFLLLRDLSVQELGSDATSMATPEFPADKGEFINVRSHADHLFQAWSEMYGLEAATSPRQLKPYKVKTLSTLFPESIPKAPHLEECSLLTELRRASEDTEDGEYPDWACAHRSAAGGQATHAFCNDPKPPWIRRGDSDNLPLTRVAQRDIWIHQFPRDCKAPGVRFLLIPWPDPGGHGMGSQLHLMTVALSLALRNNRVLVPWPGSFTRANHQGCTRLGAGNSSTCYFFPLTSQACVDEAMKHAPPEYPKMWMISSDAANSSERLVALPYSACLLPMEASAAERWGEPWKHMAAPFHGLDGVPPRYKLERLKVNWWRSQALRFLVRWPSSYLCHLTNRARHSAYGRRVALEVVHARAAQLAYHKSPRVNMSRSEGEILEKFRMQHPSGRLFREPLVPSQSDPDFTSQFQTPTKINSTRAASAGMSSTADLKKDPSYTPPDSKSVPHQLSDTPRETFPLTSEPYIPRPIVSLHVRRGDKAGEMQVFSLGAFMWLAQHVRAQVPDVKHIWLSTESQPVLEELTEYPDWEFLYTHEARQGKEGQKSFEYEKDIGMEAASGSNYVNVIIGSQCDVFIGTLASNWDRVINELRLTNGRLHALYLTLNNDEW